MNVSSVVDVQTQGRADKDEWMTDFRLEYSEDCVNFIRALGLDGSDKVCSCFMISLLLHVIQVIIFKKNRSTTK